MVSVCIIGLTEPSLSGESSPESRSKAFADNPVEVDVIFETEDPLVAIGSDRKNCLYVETSNGDVFMLSNDYKSEKLCSGLSSCGFSLRVLAVLPNGELLVNTCTDKKDALILVDQKGEQTKYLELEENLISMTSDASGKVYLGFWLSEGNLSVNFNPNYLGGADQISGQVLELGNDKALKQVYEGGLPMALTTSQEGALVASIWGQKGPLRPEKKSYSVSDPRHVFWIALSDQAEVRRLNNHQELITNDINSVSSMVLTDEGDLYVYGISEEGERGIYQIDGSGNAKKLILKGNENTKGITGMAYFNGKVHFSNTDGKVFRLR